MAVRFLYDRLAQITCYLLDILPSLCSLFLLKMLSAYWNLIHFENKIRSWNAENFGSVGQRAAKLLAVKVGVLKKKSAASAIPPELSAIAFGLGSNPGPLQSFSKFDSRQFCSPLTYRSQIFSIERSIPLFNCVKSSRCWQHFKGGFCPVKVTSFS